MKVAVVVYTFPVVSETFVINHINSLINSGNEVTVFSINERGPVPVVHPQLQQHDLIGRTHYGKSMPGNFLKRVGRFIRIFSENIFVQRNFKVFKALNVFRFGKSALSLKMFFHCQAFLKENEFDVIHCHFGNVGSDVLRLQQAGMVSGKLVVSFHGIEFLKKELLEQNDYYKGVFQNFHRIVANSGFTFQRLVSLGCNPQKLVILPVIASDQVFDRTEAGAGSSSVLKVLTIARLVEKKGVAYGIRAMDILRRKYKVQVAYDVVGNGPLMPELAQLVKDLDLEDRVVLRGSKSQDEVAGFLAQADLFLLPSIVDSHGDTETQGLVLLEAQLMGIPVVSTKVGGIADSVQDRVSGLLVEEKNPQQIAAAIYQLFHNDALRKTFGKKGKEFVQANFNSEVITEKMNRMYAEVVNCSRNLPVMV